MCNLLWLESLFTISTAIPHTTFFKHTAVTQHICPLYWDFAQDQTCSDERASLVQGLQGEGGDHILHLGV